MEFELGAEFGVCPAHAGMSPGSACRWWVVRCLPRTRGDEP